MYGCYAFVKRGIADYLFGRIAFAFFDFSEPRVSFLLDYLVIMALFAFIGMWIVSGLLRLQRKANGSSYERDTVK